MRDGVEQNAWLVGRPERTIATLKQWEAEYPGLDHALLHWAEDLHLAEFKEQLTRFARQVMPAFANRA